MLPSVSRRACSRSSAAVSASPVAVPPSACRPSSAVLTVSRVVVGSSCCSTALEYPTKPTSSSSGTSSRNDFAAPRAASSREGLTSSASIDPDRSVTNTTDAFSTGTSTSICGRANAIAQRDGGQQRQGSREALAPCRRDPDQLGGERGRRVAHRELAPAPASHRCEHEQQRDDREREQHLGAAKLIAAPARGRLSQSLPVESPTCVARCWRRSRLTVARRSASAAANASRNRVALVSASTCCPVSGSTRTSGPASGSAASSGSTTSTATTEWRAATARSGARQPSSRKSRDHDDEAAGSCKARDAVQREADPAPACRRRRVRRPRAAASERLPARRAHRRAAARAAPRRPRSSTAKRPPRRTASRATTSVTPSATSHLSRSAGPEGHRGGDVEHEPRRDRTLGNVHAHVRDPGPGARRRVQPAHVVAGLVRPQLGELGARSPSPAVRFSPGRSRLARRCKPSSSRATASPASTGPGPGGRAGR